MNVLVVTDYYLPHWTGISKSLSYLVHTLVKKHQVRILCIKHDQDLPDKEEINGALVKRIPYFFAFSRAKYSPLLFIYALPNIVNANIILVNSPSVHIFPLALIIKLFGKKLYILHQGDLILPHGFTNRVIEKAFKYLSILSFFFANKLATFSMDYAFHSTVLNPFLTKCHSFIPTPAPSKKTDNLAISNKLNDLKKKHTVLYGFAGRFVEEKGFDLLFRAIPLVMKYLPQAHFVYAGETKMDYENFYSKTLPSYSKVKKNITELGLLDEKALKSFYNKIDFIVVPSRSDCFPFVQLEAMSSGVPSVVSDIPGARFLVKESGFGLLVRPDDPTDLAHKLVQAYSSKDMLKKRFVALKKIIDQKENEKKINQFVE